MYYCLKGHEPVSMENALEWALWMATADRSVAYTQLGGSKVSTIFLGLDHDHLGTGVPILFETMVFGGEYDEYCRRYCTWDEAEEGHAETCAMVEGI